jgi:uncharacterized protein YndB with AHSA1/START domain
MSTTPTVPYRLEFSVEVPGTQEQVWEAVATAKGMSAWFLPTQLEEREGGVLHFSMGPEMGSDGHVTGWEPPRRIAYEEDWASLMGKGPDELSPMTSEFVVEALSGGTCVVRVTTSGFGTGADWESEWWDDMGVQWQPYFDNLRVYLEHFAGQEAASLEATATHATDADALWASLRNAAALTEQGAIVTVRGATGTVEKLDERRALVRLTAPIPGILGLFVYSYEEGEAVAGVRAYLFSPDAADYVQSEEPGWHAWLQELHTSA